MSMDFRLSNSSAQLEIPKKGSKRLKHGFKLEHDLYTLVSGVGKVSFDERRSIVSGRRRCSDLENVKERLEEDDGPGARTDFDWLLQFGIYLKQLKRPSSNVPCQDHKDHEASCACIQPTLPNPSPIGHQLPHAHGDRHVVT
ncbi:hypothetical protein KCU93_g403, partial [Aureobasidium melanogenum]